MNRKKYLTYGIPIAIVTIAFFIWRESFGKIEHPRDYAEIVKSKVLNVVTEYNSISYFVDGDSLTGFHYEILKEFAKDKGLKLNIHPEMSFSKQLQGIYSGKYDLIANSNTITTDFKDSLNFTTPIILNRQILVQRKKDLVADSMFIRTQLDLSHKTLNVVKDSPAILRIKNLSSEIGDTIYINEIEKYGQEQLLAMVAHGDIDYAVCDESIAKKSIQNFPQLDIKTPIGFTQFYSWAINKDSKTLLDTLNLWIDKFKKSDKFKMLLHKYYNK